MGVSVAGRALVGGKTYRYAKLDESVRRDHDRHAVIRSDRLQAHAAPEGATVADLAIVSLASCLRSDGPSIDHRMRCLIRLAVASCALVSGGCGAGPDAIA